MIKGNFLPKQSGNQNLENKINLNIKRKFI